jgi:hypothetical protein
MVRVAQDALVVVPRAEDHGTFLATGLIDNLFQRRFILFGNIGCQASTGSLSSLFSLQEHP